VQWHHLFSPQKKKFKATPLGGKVMATFFFWDAEGLILEDIKPYGQTINSDMYINTLNS
jgi:hypothetical protein